MFGYNSNCDLLIMNETGCVEVRTLPKNCDIAELIDYRMGPRNEYYFDIDYQKKKLTLNHMDRKEFTLMVTDKMLAFYLGLDESPNGVMYFSQNGSIRFNNKCLLYKVWPEDFKNYNNV